MTHRSARQIVHDHYKDVSLKVRLYNFLRLSIFPIDWVSERFKGKKGTVLCLGCGYGVLETVLAVRHPQLEFIASDLIAQRIAAAKRMVVGVSNIQFDVIDVTKLKSGQTYDHIVYIDLMHHLAKGEQEKLLDKIWKVLNPGGTVVMKDVDVAPRWKYYWNMTHDRLMAGLPLTYYPSSFYKNYFKTKGATVEQFSPTHFRSPYNHYCLVATKPK